MGVGEMVVDASEIINTLRGGGITSVGYAVSEVRSPQDQKKKGIMGALGGITGSFKKHDQAREELMGEDKTARILSLVRRAMLGRLTLPCDYHSAERALVLIAGSPNQLDRKGIEKAKNWVEENIAGVEVRGGDYPVGSSHVAAIVLLSSIKSAPRVTELLEIARKTREDVEKSVDKRNVRLDEHVDPLFE
jgi:cell division GTPase FtsZ